MEILEKMSRPLDLSDRESLLKSASTSLNSKVGLTDDIPFLRMHGIMQNILTFNSQKLTAPDKRGY